MVILIGLFLLAAMPGNAGYLEARYGMGKTAEIHMPLRRDSALQIRAEYLGGFIHQAGVRAKEAAQNQSNPIPASRSAALLWKPWSSGPFWVGVERREENRTCSLKRGIYLKNKIGDWRVLENIHKTRTDSITAGYAGEYLSAGIKASRLEEDYFVRLRQTNSAGNVVWNFDESIAHSGWVMAFAAEKRLSGSLLVSAIHQPKSKFEPPNSLPAQWGLGLVQRGLDRELRAEVRWSLFSKIKNKSLFDRREVQLLAAGNKEPVSPDYHDAIGLRFSFKNALSKFADLYAESGLRSHPVERRVISPDFSLGLGLHLGGSFYFKTMGSLSYQDYFGDGIFWAPDQRVGETKIGLNSTLVWKI